MPVRSDGPRNSKAFVMLSLHLERPGGGWASVAQNRAQDQICRCFFEFLECKKSIPPTGCVKHSAYSKERNPITGLVVPLCEGEPARIALCIDGTAHAFDAKDGLGVCRLRGGINDSRKRLYRSPVLALDFCSLLNRLPFTLDSSCGTNRVQIKNKADCLQAFRSVELSAHKPAPESFPPSPSAAGGAVFQWEPLADQNPMCSRRGCGSLDRVALSCPRTRS
jgi:hypothetical protein